MLLKLPLKLKFWPRLAPGADIDGFWTILRSGLWRLYYKLSAEGKKRFFDEFMPLLHDTKHDVMAERDNDSYYLVYLGSKPSARGKGYARKLIQHMTSKVLGSLLLPLLENIECSYKNRGSTGRRRRQSDLP